MNKEAKNLYERRKINGLCPRCGKELDRQGHYCKKCLEKTKIYKRETMAFRIENHICTCCGKVKVPKNERTCPECRAKRASCKKPLTEEQKIRYGNHFREQQKSLYQERKSKGICTKCGKLRTDGIHSKCAICRNKDAEYHRMKREVIKGDNRLDRCGWPQFSEFAIDEVICMAQTARQ